MAHKLSVQLRASEDRVQQLESEVEHLESCARRAEVGCRLSNKRSKINCSD